MPNDRFTSQNYQDRLAIMPRICKPEAMSNDRGPAAEGVAHKIKKLTNIRVMVFDRYEIHIQALGDFVESKLIVSPSSSFTFHVSKY